MFLNPFNLVKVPTIDEIIEIKRMNFVDFVILYNFIMHILHHSMQLLSMQEEDLNTKKRNL